MSKISPMLLAVSVLALAACESPSEQMAREKIEAQDRARVEATEQEEYLATLTDVERQAEEERIAWNGNGVFADPVTGCQYIVFNGYLEQSGTPRMAVIDGKYVQLGCHADE